MLTIYLNYPCGFSNSLKYNEYFPFYATLNYKTHLIGNDCTLYSTTPFFEINVQIQISTTKY